jgi:hypothetical protein
MAKNLGLKVVFFLLFSFVVLYGCSKDEVEKNVIEPYDEKIIWWDGNIDDPFDDSTVILVMARNFSGINKVHNKSFFGNIGIESIEDLTYLTDIEAIEALTASGDFRQILRLTLLVKSKENVIKAVRHLEKIIGIMSAESDFLY